MKKEQEQAFNTSESAENANKENYLPIVNQEVEGTPFRIVGSKEQGYSLTIGRFKLTNPATLEETMEKAYTVDYTLIANMIVVMLKIHDQIMADNIEEEMNKEAQQMELNLKT